jgi:RNA polymerase sigma-32 factor
VLHRRSGRKIRRARLVQGQSAVFAGAKTGVTMSTARQQTALSLYRAEIHDRRALTPGLERDLAARYKAGDRDAGRQLIEACLPFVVSIAIEYRRWGIPLEDIVQEGNIGLLKATERFDPSRECRLVTYAAYWIRAEIRDFVVRGYRIVRIGASKGERRALRIYRKTRERDPGVLSELSGLSPERTRALLPLLMARDVSLDKTVDAGPTPVERLVAPGSSPEEQVGELRERTRMSAALAQAIAELPDRERRIVEWRWLSEAPMTLEQLGVQFGISKERVRQLEERAKKRMRQRVEALVAE